MKLLPLLAAITAVTSFGAHNASAQDMVLKSQSIKAGAPINKEFVFNGFGCTGDNVSPQLSWSGVPKDAKSLALNVYDPDAPTGSGWWHWVAFNIPVNTKSLPKGASGTDAMPKGTVESITDYGAAGYGGPCPPVQDDAHRYIFTLYALDTETLPLDAKASGAKVGYYLGNHAIAKASLIATYDR